MQLGGALAKLIALDELPSAAGHVVSPVMVAPAIVLGSGIKVVVGIFGSMLVVEEPNGSAVSEVPAAGELSLRVTSLTIPNNASAAIGINNTYMPVRLRFSVRACRASSSRRC